MCMEQCVLNILAENIKKNTEFNCIIHFKKLLQTKVTDFNDKRRYKKTIPFLGLSMMRQWGAVPVFQRNLAISILIVTAGTDSVQVI